MRALAPHRDLLRQGEVVVVVPRYILEAGIALGPGGRRALSI